MDLQRKVADSKAGDTATLGVWRDKKKINISIKIAERPEEQTIASKERVEKEGYWRGLKVSEISDEARRKNNIPLNIRGVLITDVEPGSPADECEITPGAIIRQINNIPISNLNDFENTTKKIDKKTPVRLYLLQEESGRFCVLKGEK